MLGYKSRPCKQTRVSPIKMHGHKLTYWQLRMWFTFPIAVTVVFSLRLSSEHPKLSLSSSSIGAICSRELDILTNTFGLLEQQGSNRAGKQLSVTGVTSHVNKPEPGCQTRSQRNVGPQCVYVWSEHNLALPKRAAQNYYCTTSRHFYYNYKNFFLFPLSWVMKKSR